MEASLLQFYAPRDPLAEVLTGQITVRKFRVMCEGIPITPQSPLGRVLVGPWSDLEWLAHANVTATRNVHAVTYNANRAKGAEAYHPEKVDTPVPTYWQRREQKKKRHKDNKSERHLLDVIARNQQLNS